MELFLFAWSQSNSFHITVSFLFPGNFNWNSNYQWFLCSYSSLTKLIWYHCLLWFPIEMKDIYKSFQVNCSSKWGSPSIAFYSMSLIQLFPLTPDWIERHIISFRSIVSPIGYSKCPISCFRLKCPMTSIFLYFPCLNITIKNRSSLLGSYNHFSMTRNTVALLCVKDSEIMQQW